MSPAAFAEIAVCLHGALGLYREGGWLSLVRVTDVGCDAGTAWIEVEPVPAHGLRSDHAGGWGASSIWPYLTVTPTCWRQPYPSVSIDFDPALVDAVVRFAAALPPGYTPDHHQRLGQFMREFRDRATTSA